MPTAQELLSSLSERGAHFWFENGQLRFQAPRGVVGPDQRRQLASLRPEIESLLNEPEHRPIGKRMNGCTVPLTCLQRRWMNYRTRITTRKSAGPNMLTRIHGPLQLGFLSKSLQELVHRHESLRTRFVEESGTLRQEIDVFRHHALDIVDLTNCASFCHELNALIDEFFQEKVDIVAGPLFATRIFRLSSQEHVLVTSLDHMISDGESNNILHQEMWILYDQMRTGISAPLPELPIQFADYAVWQQSTWMTWRLRHESYWREKLAGAPTIEIPLSDNLQESPSPLGAEFTFQLDQAISGRLRDAARREKALLALLVLSIHVIVMSQWCRQTDLVISLQSHGRYRPELESMIGFVTHLLFLRVAIRPHESCRDVLKTVVDEFYSAYEHMDFDRVSELLPECMTELGFCWTPMRGERAVSPRASPSSRSNIKIESSLYYADPPPYKFAPFYFDGDDGIYCTVWYRPDKFSTRTIKSFELSFRRVADKFAGDLSGGVLC